MNISDEALKARTICYKPIDIQFFTMEVMRAMMNKIFTDVSEKLLKEKNERDNQKPDNNDTHTAAQ